MNFQLPLLKENYDIETGKVDCKEEFLDCELNFSIDAEQTWEETFPELSKQITLFDYVEKMKDVQIADQATAGIALKIVYSFMLFDKKMGFREFVRMFTFNDISYFEKLCRILMGIITYINERNASKKNS